MPLVAPPPAVPEDPLGLVPPVDIAPLPPLGPLKTEPAFPIAIVLLPLTLGLPEAEPVFAIGSPPLPPVVWLPEAKPAFPMCTTPPLLAWPPQLEAPSPAVKPSEPSRARMDLGDACGMRQNKSSFHAHRREGRKLPHLKIKYGLPAPHESDAHAMPRHMLAQQRVSPRLHEPVGDRAAFALDAAALGPDPLWPCPSTFSQSTRARRARRFSSSRWGAPAKARASDER
jgi:hypothetical protein